MNGYKTHSFYKYLLSTYYVSVTVLRSGNTAMNKQDQNPYPNKTTFEKEIIVVVVSSTREFY